jgi:hypothetical protein
MKGGVRRRTFRGIALKNGSRVCVLCPNQFALLEEQRMKFGCSCLTGLDVLI